MNMSNANNCPQFKECMKISIVLDHDLLDWQYQDAINNVCRECTSKAEMLEHIFKSGCPRDYEPDGEDCKNCKHKSTCELADTIK